MYMAVSKTFEKENILNKKEIIERRAQSNVQIMTHEIVDLASCRSCILTTSPNRRGIPYCSNAN